MSKSVLILLVTWQLTSALVPRPAGAAGNTPDNCTLNSEEQRLVELLTGKEQMRPHLRCHADLQEFARARAEDMAAREYFSHHTPERQGPNELLRNRGYPLPPSYRDGLSNNIESILGGIRSPEEVFRLLTGSSAHRGHLLGDDPAFREQNEFGVAHYRDLHSPHVDYWVIVIARRSRPDELSMICTPEPAECFTIGGRLTTKDSGGYDR